MDSKFSNELKELIASSREIAIDLGYDYISTIHFFLADCESKRVDSILKFGFKSEAEYQTFKQDYKLQKENYLDFINESLPLTKEAEITIRLSEKERKLQGDNVVFPRHLFIATLKNKDSFVFECFKQDTDALNKLINFYKAFEKNDLLKNEEKIIDTRKENQVKKSNSIFLHKIKKALGLIK